MILDDRLEFCDATAANGSTVSILVGDVVDTHVGTLNTLQNMGACPLYFVVQVTTAYSGGTSAQFQLATDSTANLATSKTVHIDTGAIAVATLVAGYQLVFTLPNSHTYERYMGVWLTTVGVVAAGAINAFLTEDPQLWNAYADNVS